MGGKNPRQVQNRAKTLKIPFIVAAVTPHPNPPPQGGRERLLIILLLISKMKMWVIGCLKRNKDLESRKRPHERVRFRARWEGKLRENGGSAHQHPFVPRSIASRPSSRSLLARTRSIVPRR